MYNYYLKNKVLRLCLFFFLYLMLILMSACGGGGGGGSDSSSGSDSSGSDSSDITSKDHQVAFSNTVLDHFQDQTYALKNNGTASASIGQVAQANPLNAPFSILNDQCSGKTLAPSAACTLQVRFLPTAQGTFSDSFDIPSGTGETIIMTVNVSGDGRALNVSINQIDTSDCPTTVRLFVTVSDRYDDPVTALTKDEFLVLEDNVSQGIDSFANNWTTPVSVMLVLDYSGSMLPFISDVEAAAKSLIDQLDLNSNTDEAAVSKFAASVDLKQAYTDDKNSLLLAIDNPYMGAKDQTVLYDALWQAVDITADIKRNLRRAVVVLTDGRDEGSYHNLTEVIDSAQKEGIPVFTIGLGNVFLDDLQIIADETGGQYFLAPTSGDLQAIYQQIADILTQQYVIEYTSRSSGGAIITLDVEIDDAKDGSQGEDSRDVPGC
jgi:Ca-activated chloride channel family protein